MTKRPFVFVCPCCDSRYYFGIIALEPPKAHRKRKVKR